MPASRRLPASITISKLHSLLTGSEEIAVLDVRDAVDLIDDGAILLAAHLPIGDLRRRVSALVPLRDVRIAILDVDGGELALRAQAILRRLGYTDVSIIDGGLRAWKAAGHATYNSSYIFGLAFATFLEAARPTPHVEAEDLAGWLQRDNAPLILDTRTSAEFATRALPGAVQATGADTVRLALAHFDDPERPVVVNCAGYTRSITAAQALIDAGLANPVHILRDGTKAWKLAGLAFQEGGNNPLAEIESAEAQKSAVTRLRERFGIAFLDTQGLARAAADAAGRTTFFLDVRPSEAFVAGHVEGFRSVPHETIWPWTLRHLAVLRARVVLADDGTGLRAAAIASWLKRQGWEDVSIYLLEARSDVTVPALEPEDDAAERTALSRTDVRDLDAGTIVADVSPSAVYARGHIPGARLVTAARLGELVAAFPGRRVVVTAEVERDAEDVVLDYSGFTGKPLTVLRGGNPAWTAGGGEVETGLEGAFGPVTDAVPEKWDAPDWRDRFLALMEWEHTLPEQLARETASPFRDFPSPPT